MKCLETFYSPLNRQFLQESPWSSPQSSTPISGNVSIAKSFETPSFHSPIVLPGDSRASVGKDQPIGFEWIYLIISSIPLFAVLWICIEIIRHGVHFIQFYFIFVLKSV